MKFRPLNDWALIQRLDAEEKSKGGIIIPDTAKERPAEGIIVAIGPGRDKTDKKDKHKKKFEPTTLQPGQRVIYAKYMATEIEVDNEEITLVREEDILGTIEETTPLAVRNDYGVKEKPVQAVTIKKKSEIAPAAIPEKKGLSKKKPSPKKAKTVKKTPQKAVTKKKPQQAVKTAATRKKASKKAVISKKKSTKKTAKKTKKKKR